MDEYLPLIERYRPKTFSEVVGFAKIDEIKSIVDKPRDMPNLLFVGPPGVGKTTLAKIIIKYLEPVDVLRINGSDTTGVDVIRDKVYNFVSSRSTSDKPKVVWIEEADFLSANAYAALRSMIEQYMMNSRYVFTANYANKIPDPIKSRFSVFEFSKPNDIEVYERVQAICDMEGIKVREEILKDIIKKSRGDIRTVLNTVQKLSSNENKTISEFRDGSTASLALEVYELINNGEWTKIRYEIPNKHPDYENLLVELADLYAQSSNTTTKKANITEIISDGLVDMSFSFNKDICFSAVSSRIMRVLAG